MCTALAFRHYFGRNLDLEHRFRETVTVMPRNFPLELRCGSTLRRHHALIGMATVERGYPLYYDATNECGLSMAGLNFPGNAFYRPFAPKKENITAFELIPWLLGTCENVEQALCKLERVNLWAEAFSDELPLSPLHWFLADEERAVAVEPMEDGLQIHDDPAKVLTNNPPLPFHLQNLAQYLNLTPRQPQSRFGLPLQPFSLGMGSLGLPGDPSSPSRFVRAAYAAANSVCGEGEEVAQFFHILGNVAQLRGLTEAADGNWEYTLYTSCCDTRRGIYYYTTYENSSVTGVDMHREDLEGTRLVCYPWRSAEAIMEN